MRELLVFGLVGGLATLTHYCIAVVLVKFFMADVYIANVSAYLVAVFVSYIGHSTFTFRQAMTRNNAIKFTVVSLLALGLSNLVLLVLQFLGSGNVYINFAVVVSAVPVFSYFMNKLWVYK